MSLLLRASGIGVSIAGRKVLRSAELRARAGEVTALLGRNGSGKTTLLRVASGLLRPDHGSVTFRDEASPSPRLPEMARRGLFHLPERGLLSAPVPLGDQLGAVAARSSGPPADAAVGRFRLEALTDSRPRELSGGERRRAELALAWLRRPRCLLADEPFLGIAPRDRALASATLTELAGEGCAVVATGHQVRELMTAADRVTWLHAGATRELGPPGEAARHEAFRRGYLGPRA